MVAIVCLTLALITSLGWLFWQNFIYKKPAQMESVNSSAKNSLDTQVKKPESTSREVALPTEIDLLEVQKKAGATIYPNSGVTNITMQSKGGDYYLIRAVGYDKGSKVGGQPISFYRLPDGMWHYDERLQGAPDCADFNTVDLKRAYSGESCYDSSSNTSSTVN